MMSFAYEPGIPPRRKLDCKRKLFSPIWESIFKTLNRYVTGINILDIKINAVLHYFQNSACIARFLASSDERTA